MTDIRKMTIDELWQEAEMWLDGIEDMLSHRCYSEHSLTGIRAIQLDVRKHLAWIDHALLEIEGRGTALRVGARVKPDPTVLFSDGN